jgi:hypothetical protein
MLALEPNLPGTPPFDSLPIENKRPESAEARPEDDTSERYRQMVVYACLMGIAPDMSYT